MVRLLDSIAFRQDALADVIEIVYVVGEPGYGFAANLCDSFRNLVKLFQGSLHIWVIKSSEEVNVEVDDSLVTDGLGRSRLNARHVDVVVLQNG